MNNKNCTKTRSNKMSRHYSHYKQNRKQYRYLKAQKSNKAKLGNDWPDCTQKFHNSTLYFGRKQEFLTSFLWLANTDTPYLIKP